MLDFDRDIRENIFRFLPHEPTDRPELEAMSTQDLLIVWYNWTSRLVVERPRRVELSRELRDRSNPLFAHVHVGPGLEHLVQHIQAGDDLSPHLSKAALRYGYQQGSRRQDLDLMLNDWRVHHLHLGVQVEPAGYYAQRTDELLFVHFKDDAAFLIDVGTHQDWAARRLLEVIVGNWPDAAIVMPLQEGIRLVHEPTEDEYLRLRRSGVTVTGLTIDGRVWCPTGFMSIARTSLRAVEYAHETLQASQKLEEVVRRGDTNFVDAWPEGVEVPDQRDWHFDYSVNGYWIMHERTTNVGVAYE